MRLEDRLGRALHEEAEAREVDVQRLYAETQERLAQRRGRSTGTAVRPTGWSRPALVAAAVLAAAGAGWIAPGLVEDVARRAEPAATVEGGVEDTFTCPAQDTIEFGPGNDDDSFIPEFPEGAAGRFAESVGAPRYELEQDGDTATLRLGNADGTLASVSTLRRAGSTWEPVTASVCGNRPGNLVPVDGADRLGDHRGLGGEPGQLTAEDFPPGSVRVDMRNSYDVAGLVRRRSIWAEPCDRGVCLTAGSRTATITTGPVRPDPFRPEDRTEQLADPDDVVGQRSAYRLFAVYDRDGELARVSWDTKGGRVTWVEPIPGGGWPGQLFLVLAPSDDFGVLTVHPKEGEGRNYTAEQIRD